MSTNGLFCIWFDDNFAAHAAYEELTRKGIIQDNTHVTYLKDIYASDRGWGFSDHEVGLLAKLTVG